ncbi:MAG: class II aldolase/adducin family protein [Nanoarchaeota archaeon]|nr:class II aldolase/adducin family protein [Nanoarchaeota archaeon]MBU1703773.1 class II aldolase/adducin family protein [Nanoarchaeota archaeon]
MEEYVGTKFKTIFLQREIPVIDNSNKIISIAKRLSKYFPNNAGNISIRTKQGFIITATGSDLTNLKADDLVEVTNVNIKHKEIVVNGTKEPSSESFLHNAVYQARPEINAIIHGHGTIKGNIPTTRHFQPYGSIELMKEVLNILENNNIIIIKDHGFLSLGKTIEDATPDF